MIHILYSNYLIFQRILYIHLLIHISPKIIDEYNLKDKYIKLFDKLNNLNIKYSSIFYKLKDINKIDYLKEIHINFNIIKKLTIENDYDYVYGIKKEFIHFFEILFSFNNIENNLIYLNIKFKYYQIKVNINLFENINIVATKVSTIL